MKYRSNPSLKYNGKKVLLLDGNLAQVLPLIKHFARLGCEVFVLCGSKLDAGYASRYTHHRIHKKLDYDNEEGLFSLLLELIKEGHFDVVFPLIDVYAYILSKHKDKFSEFAKIYVEDFDVFINAYDKFRTMKICMENGIPCPRTFCGNSFEGIDSFLQYPLVIKPYSSNGAKGFSVAHNFDELKEQYKRTVGIFGPSLIQEFVPQTGKQFQVETIIDANGCCKLFVLMEKVRWYPLNGGSSTLNITVHNERIKENCIRLLNIIGWHGYASLDVIEDPRDNSFKIMEINPRMNGTCKICFKSGVDLASSLLEDAFNEEIYQRLDYKDGIRLRVFFKDVLWFLKSKNRFKCKPSWFSNKNTTDEFISFDDPRVGFRYFLSCFRRLKKDKKNRI